MFQNQPLRCTRVLALAITVFFFSTDRRLFAQQPYSTGISTTAARRAAAASIPLDAIAPEHRHEVINVVREAGVYRRLPITTIECDPDMYLFLVRYPEVIVNTWQLMGITRMSADRVGQFTLRASDAAGTSADIELIYGSNNLNIYYGEGVYEGPALVRRATGQCLVILKTDYHRSNTGEPLATSQLDVFLNIDNMAANVIAKTVMPIVGSTADHNFVETLRFVETLNATTVRNGPGVQGMAQRLTSTRPEVRQRFGQVAQLVSERYASVAGQSGAFAGQATSAPVHAHPLERHWRPTAVGVSPPR